MNQEDELFDFYKTDAKIKKGMESKEFYAQLAKTVREKTGNERKEAMESACFYMKGLVRDFIFKRYMTYIERDPEYKEDLEHEAYKAIMENLPRYDATKGAPSTFFYYHIKSALSHTTTTNKHQMTQADAVLKKKILKIRAEYENLEKSRQKRIICWKRMRRYLRSAMHYASLIWILTLIWKQSRSTNS